MDDPISTSPPPKRVRRERGGRKVQKQKKLRELTLQGLYIPQSWRTVPNYDCNAKKTKARAGSEDFQQLDARSEIRKADVAGCEKSDPEDFVWVLVDRSPSPEFPSWAEASDAQSKAIEATSDSNGQFGSSMTGNMESFASSKKVIRPTRAPRKPKEEAGGTEILR
eukprot:s125_g39.t1